MVDLFREIDEALREDRAKALWNRYGVVVIALAVALVLGTAGWVYWTNMQASRNEVRSADLAAALALADQNPAEAASALASYAAGAGSGHGMLARFYEAGLRAESGDAATAVEIYRSLAGDGAVEEPWRQLAQLLAVLHEVDSGDPAALQAELEPLTADDSPWRFSAREMTGLLALRAGDRERARSLFQALTEDAETPAGVSARAAELLQFLGGAAEGES